MSAKSHGKQGRGVRVFPAGVLKGGRKIKRAPCRQLKTVDTGTISAVIVANLYSGTPQNTDIELKRKKNRNNAQGFILPPVFLCTVSNMLPVLCFGY